MIAEGGWTAYPRGSEWRKWDLHIHTPHSVLHNEFGNDFDEYARTMLSAAVHAGVATIGITDYFSVEGYRQLRARLSDHQWLTANLDAPVADAAMRLLILPNIELRSTPIQVDGHDSRVNLHVVFSDGFSADDIEAYFLHRLHFTAVSTPGGGDERWPLTMTHLGDLGRRLKSQHPRLTASDLEVGMTNAVVSHEDVTEVLSSQAGRFYRQHLIVVPIDEDLSEISWDGQGHLTRKLFIQKAHMLFSANPGTRAFGLGRRHATVEEFRREFKSLKPCVHGSDAHAYERLFQPDGERHTWIKADPTWLGLWQLLNEPEHRVFIGPEPPELTGRAFRAAKLIDSVTIQKAADATTAEEWFDSQVVLNPGLCAVIGNRGSGKSALADVMGLAGNTKRSDSFSFLTGERFRNPRTGKAGQFQVSLKWLDGTIDGPTRLSEDPSRATVEKVRYIAQGYLEAICNEVTEGERSRFYAELQSVIFSHVTAADRQDFETLADLLGYLGEGTNERIGSLREELGRANDEIVQVRHRLEPEYRATVEARLAEVQRQLQAHEQAEPAIAAPLESIETPDPERDLLSRQLSDARAALGELDETLRGLRNEDGTLSRRVVAAERLIERLQNLEMLLDRRLAELEQDVAMAGLDLADLVSFRVDVGPLHVLQEEIHARRAEIATLLNADNADGPAGQRSLAVARVTELEEQLSLPEQQYQDSVRRHEEWDAARNAMIGDSRTPGTLEHAKAQLSDLDAMPGLLHELTGRRANLTREIHAAKNQLRVQFERYYRPVSDFLRGNEVALAEAFKLEFSASISETGFEETFLEFIDQRKSGPYAGVAQGRQKLASLLSSVDWMSWDSVLAFLDDAIADSDDDGRPLHIADQLRQGVSERDVLDYVFGLEYLSPVYRLTWDGRAVDELSPGERGNLLLIFYLLVDQSDIPLVIDQPEENLDNQTVVGTLVPGTRYARQRRQVVLITHNPNLAVVCDADQIIYAEMDKQASHVVTYESGSIENPRMNRRLVDVLEGTMPAFDKRAAKYIEHGA